MRYVTVDDVTSGERLAERAAVAESFTARFLGLQGRKLLPAGTGLVLIPTSSIHMFFMRMRIDAVFVDASNRVVRVARRLRPWTIGPVVSRALYCIELPAGSTNRVQEGDEIRLQTLDLKP